MLLRIEALLLVVTCVDVSVYSDDALRKFPDVDGTNSSVDGNLSDGNDGRFRFVIDENLKAIPNNGNAHIKSPVLSASNSLGGNKFRPGRSSNSKFPRIYPSSKFGAENSDHHKALYNSSDASQGGLKIDDHPQSDALTERADEAHLDTTKVDAHKFIALNQVPIIAHKPNITRFKRIYTDSKYGTGIADFKEMVQNSSDVSIEEARGNYESIIDGNHSKGHKFQINSASEYGAEDTHFKNGSDNYSDTSQVASPNNNDFGSTTEVFDKTIVLNKALLIANGQSKSSILKEHNASDLIDSSKMTNQTTHALSINALKQYDDDGRTPAIDFNGTEENKHVNDTNFTKTVEIFPQADLSAVPLKQVTSPTEELHGFDSELANFEVIQNSLEDNILTTIPLAISGISGSQETYNGIEHSTARASNEESGPEFKSLFPSSGNGFTKAKRYRYVWEGITEHPITDIIYYDPEKSIWNGHLPWRKTTLVICVAISVPFLVSTLLIYLALPEMRQLDHGKSTACYILAVISAYVSLAVTQFFGDSLGAACFVLGYLMHFSILSIASWLNVMCIDIFIAFRHLLKKRGGSKFGRYNLYGWGIPGFVVGMTLLLNYLPDFKYYYPVPDLGGDQCFYQSRANQWIFCYGPLSVLMAGNLVLFTATGYLIHKHSSDTRKVLSASNSGSTGLQMKWYRIYGKLFFFTGMNWVGEILSQFVDPNNRMATFFLSDLTNALLGPLVFAFLVLQKRVVDGLRRISEGPGLSRSLFKRLTSLLEYLKFTRFGKTKTESPIQLTSRYYPERR